MQEIVFNSRKYSDILMTNFQRLSAKTSDLHSCIIETYPHTPPNLLTQQLSNSFSAFANSRSQLVYWTRSERPGPQRITGLRGRRNPVIGRASSKRPAGCHTGVKGGAWPLALPSSLPITEVETPRSCLRVRAGLGIYRRALRVGLRRERRGYQPQGTGSDAESPVLDLRHYFCQETLLDIRT